MPSNAQDRVLGAASGEVPSEVPSEAPSGPCVSDDDLAALQAFVATRRRLFVLTGAGCSTESGIADYRDQDGAWKRPMPTTFKAFTEDSVMRRRYWARGMIGWRHFGRSQPNAAHRVLAQWEQTGRIGLLVTQNVDGLHQAAGSRSVVDLHGRLDTVCCLSCGQRFSRNTVQQELERRNPAWAALEASMAPDGDADLELASFDGFDVPVHEGPCGGMLKPDVVFFGEAVPRERVDQALRAMDEADGMLIVGSSLMVYSGYRFALAAAERQIPVAAINIGHTRADALLALKVEGRAGDVLSRLS